MNNIIGGLVMEEVSLVFSLDCAQAEKGIYYHIY